MSQRCCGILSKKFRLPVILSEGTASRSEAVPQSKDPCTARSSSERLREFFQATLHRENALTLCGHYQLHRGPSTPLAFASRTPTPLRMTWCDWGKGQVPRGTAPWE